MKKDTYNEVLSGLQQIYEQACARNTVGHKDAQDNVLEQNTLETIKRLKQLRGNTKMLQKSVIENTIGMS